MPLDFTAPIWYTEGKIERGMDTIYEHLDSLPAVSFL